MKLVILLLLSILTAGCATPIVELSAPLSVTEVSSGSYRLQDAATIKIQSAAPVALKAGTVWTQIGTIEQGAVFDTRDQVVIVNSFDVHEAALVVSDGTVVGLYLKALESYVEADPITITLTKEGL